MPTVLVTGGCGFIGSNFVRHLLATDPAVTVVNFDALTYAGNLANLADLAGHPRYTFVKGDITDRDDVRAAMQPRRHRRDPLRGREPRRSQHPGQRAVRPHERPRHADPARRRPRVQSRQVRAGVDRRGVRLASAPTGLFTEDTPLHPNSPYSASKAAADLLVQAYQHTFGLPAVITRCSNNYGPYQFPEKLIPLFVTQPAGRRAGAGVRRRACRSATGFTSSTTAAAWRPRGGRARPARCTTSAAGARRRTSHLTQTAAEAARQAGDADPVRRGPPGPRPPVRDRLHEGRARTRLDAASDVRDRACGNDRRGTRRTPRGSPRSRTRTT